MAARPPPDAALGRGRERLRPTPPDPTPQLKDSFLWLQNRLLKSGGFLGAKGGAAPQGKGAGPPGSSPSVGQGPTSLRLSRRQPHGDGRARPQAPTARMKTAWGTGTRRGPQTGQAKQTGQTGRRRSQAGPAGAGTGRQHRPPHTRDASQRHANATPTPQRVSFHGGGWGRKQTGAVPLPFFFRTEACKQKGGMSPVGQHSPAQGWDTPHPNRPD